MHPRRRIVHRRVHRVRWNPPTWKRRSGRSTWCCSCARARTAMPAAP